MKALKRKNLLISALATLALSTSALAVTNISAKANETPQNLVSNLSSTYSYTFESYKLRWNENTEFVAGGEFNSGDSALLFKMSINEALYGYINNSEATATVTTGTLILPLYYMGSTADAVTNLTIEKAAETVEAKERALNVDTTDAWKDEDGDKTYESETYLSKIPYEFYNAPIAVRGYVKVVENETTTYYYTDTTNAPTPKSLSEIAAKEYNAPSTEALGAVKEDFKTALMQYTLKLGETTTPIYYGDKVEMPEQAVGTHNYYTNTKETAIWDAENTVKGNTTLQVKEIDAKNYYSKATDSITFTATGITAETTTAKIDGEETTVSVSVEGENVTVSGLAALNLTVGKTYLMEIGGEKLGFTYVTAVNNRVPFANRNYLWFPELGEYDTTKIRLTTDEKVEGKATEGVTVTNLDGATYNETEKNGYKQLLHYETSALNKNTVAKHASELLISVEKENEEKEVYKIAPYIYNRVLYTAEEAKAFFFGGTTVADSLASAKYAYSMALAQDVDLGDVTITTAAAQVFSGTFDGCGHSITWKPGNTAKVSALFGNYFYGTLQNVALFPVYSSGLTGYNDRYCVIANNISYTTTTTHIENVFVKVTNSTDAHSFALGSMNNDTIIPVLKDVTYLYTVGTSDTTYTTAKYTLFHHSNIISSTGNTYDSYITNIDATNGYYEFNNGTSNVQVIIPAGCKATLGTANASNLCCIAENQEYTTTNVVKRKGINLYNYGDGNIATKVGSWQINLGSSISEITATYVQ